MSTQTEKASGLTPEEAQEFHKAFMQGFIGFTLVAVVAHFLVWQWRPWLPGVNGYQTSLLDYMHHVTSLLG